jgi:membrane associated rhomboid family serine protease
VFPLRDNIPTDRFPLVTLALIVANVAMYFLFQKGGISLGSPSSHDFQCNLVDYAVIPYEVTHPGDQVVDPTCPAPTASTWVTLFTSMFMHGGLLHLGGNMLFLWIFGNNVEDSMGPLKFIAFYLLCGLAADAAQIAVEPNARIPTIGASGAVAGVLGGYLLLFPRARVVTLIFIVFFVTILEVPAIVFLGVWILQQALFASLDLTGPSEGGVAYFAHIGGFVAGLLLIRLLATRRKREPERLGLT